MQNLIKMLEIALDINARLETLDSHIPSHFSTFEEHSPLPLWCVIVAYLAKLIKRFLSKNKEMPVARHLLRRYTIILRKTTMFYCVFLNPTEDLSTPSRKNKNLHSFVFLLWLPNCTIEVH